MLKTCFILFISITISQGSDKPEKPGKPGKNSVFCDTQGKPGKLKEFWENI